MSKYRLFAGYNVLQLIGEGAFSKVYLVEDKQLKTLHAAKRLLDKCTSLDDSQFYAEVKLIRSIPSHPNLLSTIDLVHDNNCLTLIMDLMDMSLFDLIQSRKRGLSENRARLILFEIVRGLEYLHQNGIFHRDIKPENILVKRDGGLGKRKKDIVQLADFGTISRINAPQPFASYIATRWYRAPECLLTMGYYGPKMDVWGVGCCFYEMLTRTALFPGDDDPQMLELIHDLLGTPSKATLMRFKHVHHGVTRFKKRKPKNLALFVPFLSCYGVDVLKQTIAYHPDQRISASKLLNHMYFGELTALSGRKKLSTFSQSTQSLNFKIDETRRPTPSLLHLKRVSKCRDDSVYSDNSGLTGKTFHCLSLDDRKKKKTLERLWDMTDGPEKRHLKWQIRQITKMVKMTEV